MLQGFSKPWPEILGEITGTRVLSTSSIVKYFRPLFEEIDVRLGAAGELACFGSKIISDFWKLSFIIVIILIRRGMPANGEAVRLL